MDTCTALTRRVEHLEFNKVAQALEITKLKRRVKKLKRRNKVRVLKLRRLQRVRTLQRVKTSDETVMDDVSNQGRMIAKVDDDVDVVLEDVKEAVDEAKEVAEDAKEDENEPAKVQEVVEVVTTAKLITKVVTAASETVTAASAIITTAEAQVPAATLTATPARVTTTPSRRRKGVVITDLQEKSTTSTIIPAETKFKDKELHAELSKNIDWDEVIDHVKLKANEDPAIKEQIEEDENKALQRLNETPTERAAKRQKLNEEIITFTSTQLILLVERKYPLERFTLDQMLNALRLEVEEESKVSLELLRLEEKHAKCLMLLVKDLKLPSKVDAVR
nr:hypothetical protein [Tanacetum cinerariifolium]